MPATAVLLLTAAPGRAEELEAVLGGDLGSAAPARLLVRQPDPAPAGPTVPLAPAGLFDAALVLDGAVEGLAARLGGVLDPTRSAAIAGTVHEMLPGDGPAVRLYALRRLPHLTQAAFHDYWQTVHAEFGRRALAGRGYRQLHADTALSASVAAAAGVAICDFDGAVLSAAASWDQYLQGRSTPEGRRAGADALADEENFIDHSRSMAMAYTRREG